jgi:hypothetical protein
MKKLRPREVDLPTYPNGAHTNFGASSPRVRFLDVYGFFIHVCFKKDFKALFYAYSSELAK